jgi:hypothetical protein
MFCALEAEEAGLEQVAQQTDHQRQLVEVAVQ